MGVMRRRRFGGVSKAAIHWTWLAALASCIVARTAAAATTCTLPPQFDLAAEERTLLDGGAGVVVTQATERADAAAGDVVRQANGAHVRSCADLEHAAAEALARGLVLLLGVERDGRLLAVAAVTRADAPRLASHEHGEEGTASAPAVVEPPEGAAHERGGAQRALDRVARGAPPSPPAVARTLPRPRREPTLPPRDARSAALRERAAAAATALAAVDEAAQAGMPLTAYERRLGDAEATIAKLQFGVDAAEAAVREYVEEILALHRTARDVERAKLETIDHAGGNRRPAISGIALPYFSDSKVADWVAAYPYLQVAVVEPPRETRFPVPGESSGTWNADHALELLWARAHAAETALADWARAD